MNKKKAACAIVALAVIGILIASAVTYDWGVEGGPTPVPFGLNGDGTLAENSINFQMFEVWGPVLLILGTVMFGAIIAGVCISKEEEAKKEDEE
jgi:hypothetical protein